MPLRLLSLLTALMDPTREIGKLLLILGAVLWLAGVLLMLGGRLPSRLGRLPGDIIYHSDRTTFYLPIVTSLILSAVLTLVFWLISYLRR